MLGEPHLVWVAWVDTRDYVQVDVAAAEVPGVVALHGVRLWFYGLGTMGSIGSVGKSGRETYLPEDK